MLWNAFATLFAHFDEEFWDSSDDVTLTDLIIESLQQNLPNMGKIACFKFNDDGEIDIQLSLFNNNKNALNWLLNFVADKIPNWRLFLHDDDYEIDFGLKYYICHYFTIAFHCLFDDSDESKSKLFVETEIKENENSFRKRDLAPFYQLMGQFAIYNACFPRHDRNEEAFYLKLFGKC